MKINTAYLFILILFSASCQKDMVHSSNDQSTPTDAFDYVADEAAFCVDETEGDDENDYNSDIATPMKVTEVIGSDSLPIINPATQKKQKYARRQILSTNGKSRFMIRGYGFKAQSDTSKVIATIKTDTLGICNIISWSNTQIVVDVPKLEFQTHIDKQFSLKFRVYRSNDKLNKLPVSRVKSRACISDVQANVRVGLWKPLETSAAWAFINQKRIELGKPPFPLPVANGSGGYMGQTHQFQVGSVLVPEDFYAYGGPAIIIQVVSNGTFYTKEPWINPDTVFVRQKTWKTGSPGYWVLRLRMLDLSVPTEDGRPYLEKQL